MNPKPLLIAILMCFTNVAYSQLSVCKLPKGNSRIGLNYLHRVTDQFAEKSDYTYSYNNDYLRLGFDHGITEDIQISFLPGIKIESGGEQLNLTPSLFLYELQTMLNKQIGSTKFNYFVVASGRLQNFQTQDQKKKRSTEIIGGVGMSYKYEPFDKHYLVGFIDAYYEGKTQNLFDPDFEFLHNMGLDMGLEFVLPNKTTLIAKWNPSLAGKYSSINVSLCIKY